MSPGETERSPAGSGSSRWWGKAVVACASLAALAGTVAAVATAAGADGEQAERAEARDAADSARLPAPTPAADTAAAAPDLRRAPARPAPGVGAPGPERAGAPTLGATVAVPAGWDAGGAQDLVPVTPDRFPTVVTLPDRATVLLGRLDPARSFGADALADEARRLVGSFADGAMRRTPGERGKITDVSDAADRLDGRDAHTVVRRVTTSAGAGPLVRVTTVAGQGGEPGLVLLAVAAPGPRQTTDATAADRVVRSLSSAAAPPAAGRAQAPPAAAAPGQPPRSSVAPAPVAEAARPPSSRPPVSRPAAPPPAQPTDR